MNALSPESLAVYWSASSVAASVVVFLNTVGALMLGLVVGYERSYHGRAAGMRTYGLVCMASAALTVIVGYPDHWFGGLGGHGATADATRVIQGIVTGVGFIGAGVIMKEGLSISGLTTAASIWASSAIGVLVGIGFYPSAILLTFLTAGSMLWITHLENWLPARQAIAVVVRFRGGFVPQLGELQRFAQERGYWVADGSIAISHDRGQSEWRFVVIALNRKSTALPVLADDLTRLEGAETLSLSHARN